jgi:translocation protein SEC63
LAKKTQQAKKSIWTKALLFRIFVGIFLSYLWYLNFSIVSQIEGLQSFDPYQILELDSAADIKEIRKQYRRMSLLKHPDKNPDNPLAVQEFIRLTKAYNVSNIAL